MIDNKLTHGMINSMLNIKNENTEVKINTYI